MAKPRDPGADALRLVLWAELKRGGIYEADVRADFEHVEGACDGQRVYINPAPPVVEVLLHELLHRARPSWSERRVLRESRRVMLQMDERQIRRWYRAYQAQATKRVTTLQLDEDE